MDGEDRRIRIMEILKNSRIPVSATSLAKELGVSRQIIVGDVALLRANNNDIIATNKGYIINGSNEKKNTIRIKALHKAEDIYDEICTIIDYGATVKNVSVEHAALGEIVVDLNIRSRVDASSFAERMMETASKPLSDLTKGVHYHVINAPDELTLLRVQKALNDKGYLVK